MDKRMVIKLNGDRKVTGTMRGYDQFLNIVLEDTTEDLKDDEKKQIGMVVIRGNSIQMMEPLERI